MPDETMAIVLLVCWVICLQGCLHQRVEPVHECNSPDYIDLATLPKEIREQIYDARAGGRSDGDEVSD